MILERLADGYTAGRLLENYPRLIREGIRAVLDYTTGLARAEAERQTRGADVAAKTERIVQAVRWYGEELYDHLTVVYPDRIEQIPLPHDGEAEKEESP